MARLARGSILLAFLPVALCRLGYDLRPTQTNYATDQYDFEWGWSPAPTAMPNVFGGLERRQGIAPNSTCGFISGLSTSVLTCNGGLDCGFNSGYGAAGCCSGYELVGSEYTLTSCDFFTTCMDSTAAVASCDLDCQSNTHILECTFTEEPYCITWSFTDIGYTNIGCNAQSGLTEYLAVTYNAPPATTTTSSSVIIIVTTSASTTVTATTTLTTTTPSSSPSPAIFTTPSTTLVLGTSTTPSTPPSVSSSTVPSATSSSMSSDTASTASATASPVSSSDTSTSTSTEPSALIPGAVTTNTQSTGSTATATETAHSSSSSGSSSAQGGSSGSHSSSNTGAIVGGAVGGVGALVILAGLIWFFMRRRKNGTGPPTSEMSQSQHTSMPYPYSPVSPNTQGPSQYGSPETVHEFPSSARAAPVAGGAYAYGHPMDHPQSSYQPGGYGAGTGVSHEISSEGTGSSRPLNPGYSNAPEVVPQGGYRGLDPTGGGYNPNASYGQDPGFYGRPYSEMP